MSHVVHKNDPDNEALKLDKEKRVPCQQCKRMLIIGFLSTTGIALCEFCGAINHLEGLLNE